MQQRSSTAGSPAIESLEKADRQLAKAVRALSSVGTAAGEAPLLREEVLDVLIRLRAERIALEAKLEETGR
jgi:hypothetical protein